MQRLLKRVTSLANRCQDEAVARQSSLLEEAEDLCRECERLLAILYRTLINSALDQCQTALRKLPVDELRDFKYFDVGEMCQEVLLQMRALRDQAIAIYDDLMTTEEGYNDNDGWADPSADDETDVASVTDNLSVIADTNGGTAIFFDAHPHAKKRRKVRNDFPAVSQSGTRMPKTKISRNRSHLSVTVKRKSLIEGTATNDLPAVPKRLSRVDVASDRESSYSSDDVAIANLLVPTDGSRAQRSITVFNHNTAGRYQFNPLTTKPWRRGNQSRSSQVRASSHMVDDIGTYVSAQMDESPIGRQKKKTTSKQRRTVSSGPVLLTSQENQPDGICKVAHNDVKEEVMAAFRKRVEVDVRHISKIVPCLRVDGKESVEDLCVAISNVYPLQDSEEVLAKLDSVLERSLSPDKLAIVLNTLFELLRTRSCETIQFFVARESSVLRSHIALLCLILRIIRQTAADGIYTSRLNNLSAEIFPKFVSCVFTQLVDSVYSLALPKAWALSLDAPMRVLDDLMPLLRELAQHCNSLERLSSCLLEELPIQSWVLSNDGHQLYISSVRPNAWRNLVVSEQALRRQTEAIRLQALGENMSSAEIDAIWTLLAYFSQEAAVFLESRYPKLWTLVAKILVRGVLRVDVDQNALPPSPSHLSKLTRAIDNVMILIRVIKEIPVNAKILCRVIHSAVSLQASCARECDLKSTFMPTFQLTFDNLCKMSQTANAELSGPTTVGYGEDVLLLSQLVCMPTSLACKSCVELLSLYLSLAPLGKNPRRKRLNSDVNAMVDILLKEACFVEPTLSAGAGDSFASAFSMPLDGNQVIVKRGVTKDVLVLEAVAYFKIVLMHYSTGSACFTLAFCEEIWDMLADETMKGRRVSFKFGEPMSTFSASGHCSDPLLLCITSKALIVLVSQLLNMNVLNMPLVSATTCMSDTGPLSDSQSLPYALSCLYSCLECLCYSQETLPILANTSAALGILATRMRQLLVDCRESSDNHLILSVRGLSHSTFEQGIRTFGNCFRSLISLHTIDENVDLCILSVLYMLQTLLLLWLRIRSETHGCAPRETVGVGVDVNRQSSVQINKTVLTLHDVINEDVFGGIPDDAFVAMDLELSNFCYNTPADVNTMLLQSVLDAKPSTRYVVNVTGSSSLTNGLANAAAKIAIDRHMQKICRSLALLAAADDDDCVGQLFLSLKGYCPTAVNVDDIVYVRKFLVHFGSELIQLSEISPARISLLVRRHFKFFLTNLMYQLCDSRLTNRLPSGHLFNFGRKGGEEWKDLALKEYLGRSQNHARKKKRALELWNEILATGRVLHHYGSSEKWFLRLHDDLVGLYNPCLPDSLEHEWFKRHVFLRKLIYSDRIGVRHLVPSLLASIMASLLQLMRNMRTIDFKTFEGAKCHEGVSCACEGLVVIIGFLLERHHDDDNHQVAALWDNLLVCLIVPVLKRESIDFEAVFREIIADCDLILREQGVKSHLCKRPKATNAVNPLIGLLNTFIIRHARVLVLQVARHSQLSSSRFNLEVLIDIMLSLDDPMSFVRAYDYRSYESLKAFKELSPFQVALYEDLYCFGTDHPLAQEEVILLRRLKRRAISDMLVPKLDKTLLADAQKIKILQLIRMMFETEIDAPKYDRNDVMEPLLSPLLICRAARGMRMILRKALADDIVNDKLVEAFYRCATVVATLPAAAVDASYVGRLVDWCYPRNVPSVDEYTNLTAVYLNRMICWLEHVAAAITSDECSTEDLFTRRTLLREQCNDVSGSSIQLDPWRRLILAENDVFHTAVSSAYINNVYASRPERKGTMHVWKPTKEVDRAARKFLQCRHGMHI
ncbi:hypothetical protein MPSEU_000515200 [Mayamaea pseudoterrestris]|nr:hypothetical protein MPSEU_000515200 [Mayamaea pseudoterrestris]